MRGRGARRHQSAWLRALARARDLPERRLPEPNVPGDGPPPAHRWADRDPEAAKRLTAARTVVAAIADEHSMPSENLLQPDTVRRLAWTPPEEPSVSAVSAALRDLGARRWQVELTAQPIARAFLRLEHKGDL